MLMIKKMKAVLKKNKYALALYERVLQRPIINLFKRSYPKKALFSYSTYHFNKKNYLGHSNYQESKVIAQALDSLGYQIDVVNNNRETTLDLESYDLVIGEGLPMFQALQVKNKPSIIYYGTGSHPLHCSEQSNQRLLEFYKKYNYLAQESIRTNDARWAIAASLADAVICIGNHSTQQTFLDNQSANVLCIDPTFHPRDDARELGLKKSIETSRRSLLWFGSYGLLHKGLDLAVEAARSRPHWHLHICGHTPAEDVFLQQLDLPANVTVHGFVNVLGDEFKAISQACCFTVLPSCSEGIATSIITAAANGAMIPLVTKECGYDVDAGGFLIELSADSIVSTLDKLDALTSEELKLMSLAVQDAALSRYTLANYTQKMNQHLQSLLVS